MLWYSLEVPRRGASNEYSQHMFLSRNKKNIETFWLKKALYQELWECMNGEQRSRWYFAHEQDYRNLRILPMFEGTFLLDVDTFFSIYIVMFLAVVSVGLGITIFTLSN